MVEKFVRKIMKIVENLRNWLSKCKRFHGTFFTGKIMEIMKIAENVYENYGKCREL